MASQKSDSVDGIFLGWFLTAVLVFVIYAGIAAATFLSWKCLKDIFGSPQDFLGFSRICLDTIFLPFYALIFLMYLTFIPEKSNRLFELASAYLAGRTRVPFPVFVAEYPWFSMFGLFLIIAGVVSMPFSFATGVAMMIALAMLIGIFYAAPKRLALVIIKWTPTEKLRNFFQFVGFIKDYIVSHRSDRDKKN